MRRNRNRPISGLAQLYKARCERLIDLLMWFCSAQKDCKSCPILSRCEKLVYNPDCKFMQIKRSMDYER